MRRTESYSSAREHLLQPDGRGIEADLVLAMIPKHVAALRRLSEDSSHKIYTLPE